MMVASSSGSPVGKFFIGALKLTLNPLPLGRISVLQGRTMALAIFAIRDSVVHVAARWLKNGAKTDFWECQ